MSSGSQFQGARSVGKSLKRIVNPIYKKNGFFYAEFVLDWSRIVGSSYSQNCRPLRISGMKPHCCLYIGTSRSMATQLTYSIPLLLERIHQYFGCKIIESIKFMDDYTFSSFTPQEKRASKKSGQPIYADLIDQSVSYEPLSFALKKLGSCL